MNTLESEVFRLTNKAHQAACSGGSLKSNAALHKAARDHSVDMANQRYMDHTSKDGSSPWERIRRAGYTYNTAMAENIAAGQRDAEAVMDSWMNSPGHRRNIENCEMQSIGVGVGRASDGTLYWTQDFGGV